MSNDKVSSRRRFFVRAGAALAVPLAAAGAGAAQAAVADDAASLGARLAAHDDLAAIRSLRQTFARAIGDGGGEGLGDLFVDRRAAAAAAAGFAGVRRLAPADFGEHDRVEIAADGRTARAEAHCTVETETALDADGTLAEMARAQGEGFVRRAGRRVLVIDYVRQGETWKIASAAFAA